MSGTPGDGLVTCRLRGTPHPKTGNCIDPSPAPPARVVPATPVCGTCGGRGRVESQENYRKSVPCPECAAGVVPGEGPATCEQPCDHLGEPWCKQPTPAAPLLAAPTPCEAWCGESPTADDTWDPAVFIGTVRDGSLTGKRAAFCTSACRDARRPLLAAQRGAAHNPADHAEYVDLCEHADCKAVAAQRGAAEPTGGAPVVGSPWDIAGRMGTPAVAQRGLAKRGVVLEGVPFDPRSEQAERYYAVSAAPAVAQRGPASEPMSPTQARQAVRKWYADADTENAAVAQRGPEPVDNLDFGAWNRLVEANRAYAATIEAERARATDAERRLATAVESRDQLWATGRLAAAERNDARQQLEAERATHAAETSRYREALEAIRVVIGSNSGDAYKVSRIAALAAEGLASPTKETK